MKNHLNLKSRILAMFLVITLAVAQIMPVFAFSAETDPTIVVSEAIGAPGGTASVTVDLKNNPGIVSMTLSMSYNDEILTLTEVNDAGILGANAHKPEYVDPYTLAWVNDTATTNFTANGTIVTFVFTVAETAEKGTIVPIEIAYDYDNYDIYDKDGTQVRFEIDNGSVTVGEPGPNALSDFTYTTSGTELTITGYNGTANDVIIGSTYTIGDTEYTVVEIATEAFIGQETITSVVIPETVTTIGEAAFYDCLALTDVTVLSREAAIGEVAFGYYYASRKEYVVEGFTINGYTGSTAEAYAAADDEITFVALAEGCAHTGGEATCKDKAVCTACGASYGTVNAENHAGGTEIRDAVTASCNTPGYTGDTYCLGCNTKILDGKPVDATGNHVDADNKWESNETQHFHTCACGTKFDYTNHTGGEATCKNKAVCTACGVSYGALNASNHKGSTYLVGQKEASCYEEGYTGDTYCSDCNVKILTGTTIEITDHNPASVWSTDATHHWKECDTIGCGNLIDKAVHTGGEATCIAKAVCSVCNVAYGAVNADNHKNTEIRDAVTASCNTPGYTGDTWCTDCNTKILDGESVDATGNHVDADNKWESNETQHFHTCACGTKFDYTNHTGGEATCKDKAVCTACGASYGTVNAENHAGGTEIRDAVTASCNTPGYTGDTYCLGCNTKILDGKPVDATGNHVDADNKWESNETQHFHTCACGTKFDYTNHTGGEATCKNKAVCTACGVSYGALNASNHKGSTYLVGQKEASCYEEGYTGDTYCSDCNVKILTGTTIEITDHNPASVWSTDATHHWKECDTIGCGNLIDKAVHTGGEATCIAKAVCSVCNVAYGAVNADNHKNTEIRDAVTASCNTPGYTGDTWCTDCNTKILDGESVDATGNHVDADNKWESNETQHFHTCACGTKFDYTNHTGGEATCKDKAVCTACGTSYGTVNAENHAGDTEVRDALEPKCNLEGYTGDTYCKDCDAKIQSGEAIAKIPHNVDEWTVIKAATAEETGEKTGKCTACSEDITVITSKLVNNISPDKVEGDTKAELEAVGESNISEDVHFIANEVLDTLTKNELNEIQKVINNAADSIENEVKGKAVAAVFDLMLILRETSAGGDVIAERELELEGKVKVTLPLAKELLEEYTDLTLLHIKDDGSVEIIPFTLKNGKATFEASGFSYYTFVGTEKIDKIDSPKTGDDSNLLLWIALLFVSGSCLVVCTVGKKRAKHSK